PFFGGSRPNTSFGRITNIIDNVESRYDALVLQFNRRMTNGLQFQSSYTWSHALDNGQNSSTFTDSNDALNPFNLKAEYGTSNLDLRHRFVGSLIWEPTLSTDNAWMKTIVNGFSISPIFSAQSGKPFTASVSGNAPITPRQSTGILGAGGTARPFFLGRNTFNFPNIYVVDLRVGRKFRVTEGTKIEFLVEAFNLFNHVNVTG